MVLPGRFLGAQFHLDVPRTDITCTVQPERNNRFPNRSFLKSSQLMGIVGIIALDFRAPAQIANKKTIQLTLQCLRETRRDYAVNSGAGPHVDG